MRIRKRSCPSDVQLARAISKGADESIRDHLGKCEVCAREWEATKRLIELCQQIDVKEPSESDHIKLRAKVLEKCQVAKNRPTQHYSKWAAVFVAILAAVLFVFTFWADKTDHITGSATKTVLEHAVEKTNVASTNRGIAYPQGNARFARVSSQPDEVFRLFDGTLRIEVDPLRPGERFRVMTSDAEVEVKGTIFEVTAHADHLLGVRVSRGSVVVRSQKEKSKLLVAPAKWEITPSLPVNENVTGLSQGGIKQHESQGQKKVTHNRTALNLEPEPISSVENTKVVNNDTEKASQEELAFRAGWDALRSGKPAAAAAAFRKVEKEYPESGLVEDASFWRGIALSRAGLRSEAMDEFSSFLEKYPGSSRVGQVAVMLGWMLLDDGQLEEARKNFKKAKNDPVDRVRESALMGLEEIQRR